MKQMVSSGFFTKALNKRKPLTASIGIATLTLAGIGVDIVQDISTARGIVENYWILGSDVKTALPTSICFTIGAFAVSLGTIGKIYKTGKNTINQK
jgi:hypothetical protein